MPFKSITSKQSEATMLEITNVQIHYNNRAYTKELRNKCNIGSSKNGNIKKIENIFHSQDKHDNKFK